VLSNIRQADTWLSFGLAFVGGYGDAASFVLAKTFTGYVTGNLVLAAIAVAARDWRALLEHLSAIVTFLIGISLSVVIVRPLKAWPSWPLLPTVMGIEVILIVAASFALASDRAYGLEMFVIFVSLALGLQNGAFRRIGGISVHTTYLTGMITSLERYASEVIPPSVRIHDPKVGLLYEIWIAFGLGAGTGAAMVLRDARSRGTPDSTDTARGAVLTKARQNEMTRHVLLHSVTLSILCVISYWLITHMLVRAFSISRDDDLLGGMWAVVATVFVYRYGYEESVGAALSRMGATTLSFVLCFIYLLFFPFHLWGLAIRIGVGAVAMSLLSRPDDIITTGITTAVVMVVAAVSPNHAWKQPILRLVDTIVGVPVGVVGAWMSLRSGQRRSAMA
jgi:uncharacterized membrane protein YoaK (UPF0700 family)